MRTIVCLIATYLTFAGNAHCEELTSEEHQVWELEITYYRYVNDNDPRGYLNLFSDNVIGWPAMDPHPKGKDGVSQWISAIHSNPAEIWQYDLERLAIHSFGDVVVVHYRLRDYFVSAESGEEDTIGILSDFPHMAARRRSVANYFRNGRNVLLIVRSWPKADLRLISC